MAPILREDIEKTRQDFQQKDHLIQFADWSLKMTYEDWNWLFVICTRRPGREV